MTIYMWRDDSLYFEANTSGSTIQLPQTGTPTSVFTLETSTDGTNWTTYIIGDTITLSNAGDRVYFRNSSTTTTGLSTGANDYYNFVMTGSISCHGNINYLLNKTGVADLSDYCYRRLFAGCTSLTNMPDLPSTTLSDYCYDNMFRGCTSLTTATELPAIKMKPYCYRSMFIDCSSLTQAPKLSALIMADYCYGFMFQGCSSLVEAPQLPSTTLAQYCYISMFRGCTSLKTPPSLPAITLENNCYDTMFYECTNLEQITALAATTLKERCYAFMFSGCTKIKLSNEKVGQYLTVYRIPTHGTGTAGTNSQYDMFGGTGGTFTGTPTLNTQYYTSNGIV